MTKCELHVALHDALVLIAQLSVAGGHLYGPSDIEARERWREFHPTVRDILNKYPKHYPSLKSGKKP